MEEQKENTQTAVVHFLNSNQTITIPQKAAKKNHLRRLEKHAHVCISHLSNNLKRVVHNDAHAHLLAVDQDSRTVQLKEEVKVDGEVQIW